MKKKILIIEDDPDILDMMEYILTDAGYETIVSTDGVLLKEIDTHSPDLILLDNRLTDGFGADFCEQFKNDPRTSHYPVILVSANQHLEKLAEDCKADGFLAKPFNLDELLGIVSDYFNAL